ncbi:hypothetical protein C8J57DRAFT_1680904 [Mycena rebaudengoi]|nr:hypothetical protein C8J57DRAFT_1680904 [Mycena rebaudengoi]
MGGVMKLTSEKAHTAGRKSENSIRHLMHAGFSLVGATHRGCIAVVGLGDEYLAPLGHRSGGSSGPKRLNRERQRLQAATRGAGHKSHALGVTGSLKMGTQNLSDGRRHFAWQWSSWFTGNVMKLLREMSATFPSVLLEHLWSPGAALSRFLFSTRLRHLPTAFAKLFCTAFVIAIHQPHQSVRSCGRYKFHCIHFEVLLYLLSIQIHSAKTKFILLSIHSAKTKLILLFLVHVSTARRCFNFRQ